MQTLARKSSENREMIIFFVTYGGGGGGIEALADSVDVVIEKPRMDHRSTAGEIDDRAIQYFKMNVFFPFIDHCLMQLDQRFPADKQTCSWHLS